MATMSITDSLWLFFFMQNQKYKPTKRSPIHHICKWVIPTDLLNWISSSANRAHRDDIKSWPAQRAVYPTVVAHNPAANNNNTFATGTHTHTRKNIPSRRALCRTCLYMSIPMEPNSSANACLCTVTPCATNNRQRKTCHPLAERLKSVSNAPGFGVSNVSWCALEKE